MTKEQFAELAAVDPSEAYDRLEEQIGLRFAREKKEAKDDLREVQSERCRFRYERWSWQSLMALSIIFAGLLLWCFVALNQETAANKVFMDRAKTAEARAEKFRVMLLENQIDPETGKVFGK